MTVKAYVGGAAMIEFRKPGDSDPYDVMGGNAVRAALADAGIGLDKVQQAYASYIYGDSACGQKALYEVGLPGIPIFNVNNNCSSGSSAIFLARQAVESGMADCVLAFGFEQMQPGALKAHWDDRVSPGRLVLNALFKSRPNTPPPGGRCHAVRLGWVRISRNLWRDARSVRQGRGQIAPSCCRQPLCPVHQAADG
ncbi:hypothetical protein [Sphingomonas sp.]|uniref:thiolase family protein n=1 Tax=Sphingomonas sp. TaxID=28214 RepID=UPI0035A886A2